MEQLLRRRPFSSLLLPPPRSYPAHLEKLYGLISPTTTRTLFKIYYDTKFGRMSSVCRFSHARSTALHIQHVYFEVMKLQRRKQLTITNNMKKVPSDWSFFERRESENLSWENHIRRYDTTVNIIQRKKKNYEKWQIKRFEEKEKKNGLWWVFKSFLTNLQKINSAFDI